MKHNVRLDIGLCRCEDIFGEFQLPQTRIKIEISQLGSCHLIFIVNLQNPLESDETLRPGGEQH